MAALIGKWDLESSENFDEYMKALGVGFATRKIGGALKPTVTITKTDDGTWKIKVDSTFKSSEVTFTNGQEFEEETLDGRKCKSVITVDEENNKLVQVQKDATTGEIASTITREIKDGKFVQTLECKDVKSTRIYKRS